MACQRRVNAQIDGASSRPSSRPPVTMQFRCAASALVQVSTMRSKYSAGPTRPSDAACMVAAPCAPRGTDQSDVPARRIRKRGVRATSARVYGILDRLVNIAFAATRVAVRPCVEGGEPRRPFRREDLRRTRPLRQHRRPEEKRAGAQRWCIPRTGDLDHAGQEYIPWPGDHEGQRGRVVRLRFVGQDSHCRIAGRPACGHRAGLRPQDPGPTMREAGDTHSVCPIGIPMPPHSM